MHLTCNDADPFMFVLYRRCCVVLGRHAAAQWLLLYLLKEIEGLSWDEIARLLDRTDEQPPSDPSFDWPVLHAQYRLPPEIPADWSGAQALLEELSSRSSSGLRQWHRRRWQAVEPDKLGGEG